VKKSIITLDDEEQTDMISEILSIRQCDRIEISIPALAEDLSCVKNSKHVTVSMEHFANFDILLKSINENLRLVELNLKLPAEHSATSDFVIKNGMLEFRQFLRNTHSLNYLTLK
jgi:hypothetical protein